MNKLPKELYNVSQCREIDRLTINEYGIAGIELMRRAGAALFEQLRFKWPGCQQVSIFCGAGNNAGDGYVVGRLALAAGLKVSLYALLEPGRLKGDACLAAQDYVEAGGSVTTFDGSIELTDGVIVDALLGTGLDREVTGSFATAIAIINQATCPVVSVDIPSGLQADSGKIMGCAVTADLTVTFIAVKQGLLTGEAADVCGELYFASLNVPKVVYEHFEPSAYLIQPLSLAARPRSSHKGRNGHVLLIGGDYGFSGAIRLAAEAALRAGAGLVSVATRRDHSHLINIGRFEIMSHSVESAEDLLSLLEKVSVVVIGPGLGQKQWGKQLLQRVFLSDKPLVVDADALNLLALNPRKYEQWVLTPHLGEAARLLSCSTKEIACDRFAAVTQLQQRYGGVCVLKGAGTLVKSQDSLAVNPTGNPGMASGGMGDVLSGIIAALMAQGVERIEAVEMAVFIHGKAADLAAEQCGERGLLAADLFPFIRQLLNS